MIGIDISATRHASATVVAVAGDIDVHSAADLEDALLSVVNDDRGRVVVDLTATTFLDSTALGALVGGDNRLRPTGRAFSLVCPDSRLLRIFRISGLDTIWPIHASVDDALQTSKPPP